MRWPLDAVRDRLLFGRLAKAKERFLHHQRRPGRVEDDHGLDPLGSSDGLDRRCGSLGELVEVGGAFLVRWNDVGADRRRRQVDRPLDFASSDDRNLGFAISPFPRPQRAR